MGEGFIHQKLEQQSWVLAQYRIRLAFDGLLDTTRVLVNLRAGSRDDIERLAEKNEQRTQRGRNHVLEQRLHPCANTVRGTKPLSDGYERGEY